MNFINNFDAIVNTNIDNSTVPFIIFGTYKEGGYYKQSCINYTCKESFCYVLRHSLKEDNGGTDFVFKGATQDVERFAKMLKMINDELELTALALDIRKIENCKQDRSYIRVESEFWRRDMINIEMLACIWKECILDQNSGEPYMTDKATSLDKAKSVSDFVNVPNVRYFSNQKMKDALIHIKVLVEKLNLNTNDACEKFLYNMNDCNGIVTAMQKKGLTSYE